MTEEEFNKQKREAWKKWIENPTIPQSIETTSKPQFGPMEITRLENLIKLNYLHLTGHLVLKDMDLSPAIYFKIKKE